MRTSFDEQLALLNRRLIEMGALCEDAIAASMRAMAEEPKAAEKTKNIECEIDHAEREIEALCMKLLLQQQPVARDLRAISSALRMISDMERIGDQASDIAEIMRCINDYDIAGATHLNAMAKAARRMVTSSVDSFVRRDLGLARQVQEDDDAVDALFNTVRQELVARIRKEPSRGGECLDLFMVAKYLERIGDHAVNVAEWVEFSITGVHAKG